MSTLHTTQVDGVRTFWVDAGRPTLSASLVFRAGIVDEKLPTSGWLHLIEHLALHDRQAGALHVNGSVSLTTTSLDLHGPPEDVARVLGEITAWLKDPDLGRMEAEARVLRAESEYHGASASATALLQRFGARGAGLAGFSEPGLGRVTESGLRSLVTRVLTTGNAALALDGPPPRDLTLALGAGDLQPLPPRPASHEQFPAGYVFDGPLVISGQTARSVAATVVPAVLHDLLRRRLREEAGAAYAPWSAYDIVDRDTAVVVAGSDVTRDLRPRVGDLVLDGLNDIQKSGFPASVLADRTANFLQATQDPHQRAALAWRTVHQHLLGAEPMSLDQMIEEARAVTSDEVIEQVRRFAASLMLGVAPDMTLSTRLARMTMPSTASPSSGTTYRSRNAPASREKLVVSPDQVQVGNDHTWVGVGLSQAAGLLVVPDGARRVIAPDGWSITIEPTLWRDGREAVAQIDAAVPESRHIPVPARDAGAIPSPMSWRTRWLARSGRTLVSVGLVWLLLIAFVVVAIIGIAKGHLVVVWLPIFFGVSMVREWRRNRQGRAS